MALSRATKLSQIALASAVIGTRMDSLNNNTKIKVRVQHKADLLRTSKCKLTEERLNIIIEK